MLRYACLAALLVGGCNTNAFDRAQAQSEDAARIRCQCGWELEGYESESACVSDRLADLGEVDDCQRRAYDSVPELHAPIDCLLDANDANLSCARGARCDVEALQRCDEERSTAVMACPEIDEEASARASQIEAECRAGTPGTCPDLMASGSGVLATGSTTGQGADLVGSCGGDRAADLAFTWTAPSAGTWRIDTYGSDFDTVLYALTDCGGTELACNDDGETGFQSEIVLELAAGQTVVLVVDGFGSDTGGFVLNATAL